MCRVFKDLDIMIRFDQTVFEMTIYITSIMFPQDKLFVKRNIRNVAYVNIEG